MTRHLENLGNQFSVSLHLDEEGYLGRECPDADCLRYFKVVPGTGLKGLDLPCHCPYCGHEGPMNHFFTQAQIEYAHSIVARKVMEAATADFRDIARNFNRRMSGGLFAVKMDVQASSPLLRNYTEHELETNVECGNCTLKYSVYGVFAFCPDCGQHNSVQILDKSLDVVGKILGMAEVVDGNLSTGLIENALEDCVSTFDGFGREVSRVPSQAGVFDEMRESVSFQNLEGARKNILRLFNFDIAAELKADEWSAAIQAFQKRHLLSHKLGVVDQEYIDKSRDTTAVVGRKVRIEAEEVRTLIEILRKCGRYLSVEFGRIVP